jgi:NitT/TauT family transport system permease protein
LKLKRYLPALTGVAVLAGWYGLHAAMSPDRRFVLPSPTDVFRAFSTQGVQLWSSTLVTGLSALIGFGAAAGVSFALALFLSLSALVRASLYPYLMVLQMTPIIVFAPILIMWVGPGLPSVVLITFLICFFPLVVNTTQGLISTDRHLVDLFRLYRARKAQEIWLLRVPAALPYYLTGLRIAATLAPIGAIVGDLYAGSSANGRTGLGYLTLLYSANAEMGPLFATAALCCLVGGIFVLVVVLLTWWALRQWHDSFARTDG